MKPTNSQFLSSVILITSCLAATAVSAATVITVDAFGTKTTTDSTAKTITIDHAIESVAVGDGFGIFDRIGTNRQNYSFSSNYSFNAGTSVFDGTVTTIKANRIDGLLINSFNLYTLPTTGNGVLVAMGTNPDSQNEWLISLANINSGNYRLNIGGTVINASGGSIGGGANLVSAVPEPSEWAMMIVGLAVIAGVARRRKMADTSYSSVPMVA